jgi:hypothetical protein
METMSEDSPDGILVMGQAALHVLLKNKPKADLKKYAEAVHESGATELTGRLVEENLENSEFVTEALETVGQIATHEELAHVAASAFMPTLRRVALHCLSNDSEDAHKMLDRVFKIMGLFAFDKRNIETIVLNSGLPLVLRAVAKYPREELLMERAIKTMDFIGHGDKNYTRVVIQKGGKKVIEKIMEVYPRSTSIQRLGKGALASLAGLGDVVDDDLAPPPAMDSDDFDFAPPPME